MPPWSHPLFYQVICVPGMPLESCSHCLCLSCSTAKQLLLLNSDKYFPKPPPSTPSLLLQLQGPLLSSVPSLFLEHLLQQDLAMEWCFIHLWTPCGQESAWHEVCYCLSGTISLPRLGPENIGALPHLPMERARFLLVAPCLREACVTIEL